MSYNPPTSHQSSSLLEEARIRLCLQLEKGPQIVEIKHFWSLALYKEVYV